jgi:predicted aspartyl protease
MEAPKYCYGHRLLLPASTFTLMNLANPKKRIRMKFRVDSGAIYSVVPKTVLKSLGIKPCGSQSFALAYGTAMTRKMGNALFSLEGAEGASPVIFGEKGDTPLLGMVSLEALGYILDPLRRELRPLPMVLG